MYSGKETGSSYQYTWVKKYIVDVFVQNEEQFKICGALKIIKQSSVSHLCKAQAVV